MTAPFDSTLFFNDPFFGSVTANIQSQNVTAIFFDGLDAERQGKLLSRPGHWGRFYFQTSAINRPNTSDSFTVGSVTWRVDDTTETGDVYEVLAVSDQRKHP